jgi:hypothetical protein
VAWTYRQSTGELVRADGHTVATGYSGKGDGKNKPLMEKVHNVGPIPKGAYTISAPHDTVTHGPYVLPLTPHPQNTMYGRSAFMIHGDSVIEPGTASEGCVILPRAIREAAWNSGDHEMAVVS